MKIGIRGALIFGLAFCLAGSTTAFAVKTHNHRDAGRHGKSQARHQARAGVTHGRMSHGRHKGSTAAMKDTVKIVGLPSHLTVGKLYTFNLKGTSAESNETFLAVAKGISSCPATFAVAKKITERQAGLVKTSATLVSSNSGGFLFRATVIAFKPFTGGACAFNVNTSDPTGRIFGHDFKALTASRSAPSHGRG